MKLAGDGELGLELEAVANELSIADEMKFLENVGDIYSVLWRWDLFIFSTTEREGLGNALSEAMALGLPCVVSDVGPNPTISSISRDNSFGYSARC